MQPYRSLIAIALSSCATKVEAEIEEEAAVKWRHEEVGREAAQADEAERCAVRC